MKNTARTTRNVHTSRNIAALSASAALCLTLAACGGGGGGGAATLGGRSTTTTTTSSNTTIPAGTTLAAASYAPNSVQAGIFNQINAYRTECGFPALQENTILDAAAQDHAKYMTLNGFTVTDTEAQGNPGFTGTNGMAQAVAAGWPAGVFAGVMDVGYSGSATGSGIGVEMAMTWATGVYHQNGIIFPVQLAGVGASSGPYSGYTFNNASLQLGEINPNNTGGSGTIRTFPCSGITGIPYGMAGGETPVAPNISANGFGTPVTVVGNLGDNVELTSATMTSMTDGTTITLNILNASTDPNKELGAYEAVAYPSSPLQPNTSYQVNLNVTDNGKEFNRTFTFTTGASIA